ncbi:MAG: hypothetical protein ACE5JB_04810 [bacterium]
MCKSSIKTALVFLLIFSIMSIQIVPSLASANKNKLQVAFVGLKFENLPQDIQDKLTSRMNAILETQKSISLTKPEGARITFGRKTIAELIENQDAESFLEFAEQYQFDYVFSGFLATQSHDDNRILLVGELNRYDLANSHINRYKINKDYEKIGSELNQFKQQYVKSMVKLEDSGKNPWSILLIGGIIIAGTLTLRFGLGSLLNEGEDTETTKVDE